MRLPSARFLIGLVLTLVVCIGVAVAVTKLRGGSDGVAQDQITVSCVGGSEKSELMADPKVKQILHDKYGLTVTFNSLGSYNQVQLTADEIKQRNLDCLWPSSASAQSVFESLHKGQFSGYRAETVLQSPEVIYAGPKGTAALKGAGIVEERGNRYFIVNMKSLLLDYVLKRKTWDSLGSGLVGPMSVSSTDPAKSNSGFTLLQLELNIIATQDVFQAPSLAQAKTALPTVRALYDAQGLQASSSDSGFRQWLTQGAEYHAPLYAGYENQIIQATQQPDGQKLLNDVTVIYPDPTIYSDHPVLALNGKAGRFLDAMKDGEIQSLAWKKYGFRSSVQLGINNIADFPSLRLADRIRTTTPPNAEVTLALLACVSDANQCK